MQSAANWKWEWDQDSDSESDYDSDSKKEPEWISSCGLSRLDAGLMMLANKNGTGLNSWWLGATIHYIYVLAGPRQPLNKRLKP